MCHRPEIEDVEVLPNNIEGRMQTADARVPTEVFRKRISATVTLAKALSQDPRRLGVNSLQVLRSAQQMYCRMAVEGAHSLTARYVICKTTIAPSTDHNTRHSHCSHLRRCPLLHRNHPYPLKDVPYLTRVHHRSNCLPLSCMT